MNIAYSRLCKKCKKPFNIGSNLEICPVCRLKEGINGKRETNAQRGL